MTLFNPIQGGELTQTQQRLWKVFVFLLRRLVLSIPLYVILALPIGLLSPLQNLAAGNTFWMLSYAGYSVSQNSNIITIGSEEPFTFVIGEDCTAWKSMLFFFALIFAVPGALMKKRLLGLIIGISLIWAGNLARIFMIVLVQQTYGTQAAMFLHSILWQAGLIALVLVLWVLWLFRMGGLRNQNHKKVIRANNINQQIQDKT